MFEPARVLSLDATQRQRLEFLVRAGSTPQKLVQRARIILLAAVRVGDLPRRSHVASPSVSVSGLGYRPRSSVTV